MASTAAHNVVDDPVDEVFGAFNLLPTRAPLGWYNRERIERYAALEHELSRNLHQNLGVDDDDDDDYATTIASYQTPLDSYGAVSSPREQKHAPTAGYMDRQSAFALEDLTECSFLQLYPCGNATISFYNDENKLESISDINVDLIAKRCPVLAMAFEESRSGPQVFLEVLTSTTALPFLRFIYTGTYALSLSLIHI